MTNTDTQELSPFLKKQAELMAARADQDRDIEERQKHALVPAKQEAPLIDSGSAKYVISTEDVKTGKGALLGDVS